MILLTTTYNPATHKLVPIEPTREMWAAVSKLDDEMLAGAYDGKGCTIEQAWNCLVYYAPNPESLVSSEMERTTQAAARYEVVRRMNVEQFKNVWLLNVTAGKPFDEIIDDLMPFYNIKPAHKD